MKWLLRLLLRLYVSLWDDEAKKSKNSYLHQKVIWEIRRMLEGGAE